MYVVIVLWFNLIASFAFFHFFFCRHFESNFLRDYGIRSPLLHYARGVFILKVRISSKYSFSNRRIGITSFFTDLI